jgi:arginine repressor
VNNRVELIELLRKYSHIGAELTVLSRKLPELEAGETSEELSSQYYAIVNDPYHSKSELEVLFLESVSICSCDNQLTSILVY